MVSANAPARLRASQIDARAKRAQSVNRSSASAPNQIARSLIAVRRHPQRTVMARRVRRRTGGANRADDAYLIIAPHAAESARAAPTDLIDGWITVEAVTTTDVQAPGLVLRTVDGPWSSSAIRFVRPNQRPIAPRRPRPLEHGGVSCRRVRDGQPQDA